MNGTEYGCDRCGVTVPDGEGDHCGDERLCDDCFDSAVTAHENQIEARYYREK